MSQLLVIYWDVVIFRARDSPRRYDRDDYGDRREKRGSPVGVRGKDLDRKDIQRHRDYEQLVFLLKVLHSKKNALLKGSQP